MKESLRIDKVEVGPFFTNCYIVSRRGEIFIIDPGDEVDKIKGVLSKHPGKVKFIINTHGHIDHIREDAKFNCPVYIHQLDFEYLKDPYLNLSSFLDEPFVLEDRVEILKITETEQLKFSDTCIEVIHTPGHTPGGVCLKLDNILFSGDTLFFNSIGRTDFKGADYNLLISSIKKKLLPLDDSLEVFPGHGPATNLGREKKENPFILS